jgi:hypothetical protein
MGNRITFLGLKWSERKLTTDQLAQRLKIVAALPVIFVIKDTVSALWWKHRIMEMSYTQDVYTSHGTEYDTI